MLFLIEVTYLGFIVTFCGTVLFLKKEIREIQEDMLRRVNENLTRYGGGATMSYEDLYNMDSEDERRTNRFLIIIVAVAIVTYVPRLFALFTYGQYLWKQRKSG